MIRAASRVVGSGRAVGRARTLGRVVPLAAAAVVATALSAAQAHAQTPLPSFHVQTIDGIAVPGAQLAAAEQPWALVFVSPPCTACETLLESLSAEPAAGLLGRIAIVVGGEPTTARAYAQRLATNTARRVFLDADGSAARALVVAGQLSVAGIRSGRVEWTLTGVLTDGVAVETVLTNWLR